MKPRSSTSTPAFSAPIFLPLGAPTADQHQVVDRASGAFSPSNATSMPPSASPRPDGLGLQHDVVEARRVELLPDRDQVAVGARHQAVEHLDHVEARAERRVHRGHLEADDAAADDQHPLRHAPAARARRSNRRCADRPGMNGSFTACEPAAMIALLEAHDLLAVRRCRSTSTSCGLDELADARAPPSTLRIFAIAARPPVSLPTTLFLCARSLARSIFGAPNATPCVGQCARLVDDRGDVQQRLRRDAADVEADAAERRVALDQHRASCRGRRRGTRRCSRPGRRRARRMSQSTSTAGVAAGDRCGAAAGARAVPALLRRAAAGAWRAAAAAPRCASIAAISSRALAIPCRRP